MGTKGFKVKTENDFLIVICSRCRQNLKFHVVVLWSTAEKCTETRVARAARVMFPFLTNNILASWRCRTRSFRLCFNSPLERCHCTMLFLIKLGTCEVLLLHPVTPPVYCNNLLCAVLKLNCVFVLYFSMENVLYFP